MRQNKKLEEFFKKTQYYFLLEVKSMYYLTGKYQKRLLYLLLGPLFLIMPFPLLHQVQNVPTPSFVVCSFVSMFGSHLNQGIISLCRFLSCTPQTTIAYLWITLVSNSLVQAWHKQIHHQSNCDCIHQHFSKVYTR